MSDRELLDRVREEYESWPDWEKAYSGPAFGEIEDKRSDFSLLDSPVVRKHYRDGRIGININNAQEGDDG